MTSETQKIKEQSKYLGERVAVEMDEENRKFFRFNEGQLVEFEVTRWEGIPVKMTKEELEASEQFSDVRLVEKKQ